MPSNETTTKFKVDISELKKNISEANRQIKLANAEFKAAASSMDYMADSADGIRTKLTQLTKVLNSQESILKSYEKQLEITAKEQGENSAEADNLRIKIANQKAAINGTMKEIQEYSKKLEDAESGMSDVDKEADNLNASLKNTGKASEEASESFTVMKGVLADLAATAIKAVVQGLKDMANAAKDAWVEFDEGADNIIKATGATGAAADELTKSYANVSKTIVGDMGDIGAALGEVNTRFGYTGKELEDATTQFLKFADITGSDAVGSIQAVSRAIESAGLSYDEYGKILDELTIAAQQSGVNAERVADGLTQYGAQMRALGFDTSDTIAMFAQWEKAGVNTETVFAGLSKASANWSKSGKDAKKEFQSLIKEIQDAPDAAKAAEIATKAFGKTGVEIADAARSGRLSYEDFAKSIKQASGAVTSTFEETQDAPDKLALSVQSLKVDAAQLVNDLMTTYAPQVEKAIEGIGKVFEKLIPAVENFIDFIIDNKTAIITTISAIGAGLAALNVANMIMGLVKAFKAWQTATEGMTVAQKLLNLVMEANPIGLIVAAIAALVAAFITLWNTSEEFRQFWINLWEGIKNSVGAAWDWIKDVFNKAWEGIKKTWDGAKAFFAGVWDGIKGIFGGVKTWFSNTFQGAADAIKNIFNGIVGVIKAPINFLINALNTVIDGINKIKIPDWVPGIGGKGISIPRIPNLARGGILEKGQLGLLEGNGAEAVVPLENNRRWIAATAKDLKKELSAQGLINNSSTTSATQIYNFNQTNNSPKALDRLTIYRQTRNLMAMAKGGPLNA